MLYPAPWFEQPCEIAIILLEKTCISTFEHQSGIVYNDTTCQILTSKPELKNTMHAQALGETVLCSG